MRSAHPGYRELIGAGAINPRPGMEMRMAMRMAAGAIGLPEAGPAPWR